MSKFFKISLLCFDGDDDWLNDVCVDIEALEEFSTLKNALFMLLGLIAFFMAVAADAK